MITVGYKTDVGKRRKRNEDAILVRKGQNFFILADGVGGNQSGNIASEKAIDILDNYLDENPIKSFKTKKKIFNYFFDVTKIIDYEVTKMSKENIDYMGMATTLVFGYIYNMKLYIASIGDSRAYLYRKDKLEQLTDDHTYVNDLIKIGAITTEEAKKHSKRNMLTRAIGADSFGEPDLYEIKLNFNDKILLCSDGLYNELEDEEIINILKEEKDPVLCSEALINKANSHGGKDNISVICINILEEEDYEH